MYDDSTCKAIVYARVSTEEQAEKGYSLEGQIEDGLTRAAELGYTKQEVLILTDDVSGSVMDRPGLNKLRGHVESMDKPEVIIMYDPDRFARKLTYQLLVTEEIIKNGVQLEFINFEWKNNAEGRMFYQLRGMFAEFEREKIRERTIRGRLTKIKNHGKLSCDPRLYGYRFDQLDDVLIADPATSQIVQLIFQLCAQGNSGEAIARTLAERGIPAPRGKNWYGSTVTRILHNESYLGIYMAYKVDYHQGYKRMRPKTEQFPLSITPLISRETYDAAQRTLEKSRTNAGRPPKREYLLSGKATCYCGRAISVNVSSGGKAHTYYVCSGKQKVGYNSQTGQAEGRCCSSYWNSQVVDEIIWKRVCEQLIISRKQLDGLLSIRTDHLKTADSMLELNVLQQRRIRLEKQKNNLLELFISEGVERFAYDRKKDELNQELARLSALIMKMSKHRTKQDKLSALIIDDINNILETPQALMNISFNKKRRMIELLVGNISFNPNREIVITLNIADYSAMSCNSEGDGGL